jgi:hypothetical protein
MKKILLTLLATAIGATPIFSQEIKFGGEVKTGIYWEEYQYAGDPPYSSTTLHSKDDAGGGQGRVRLNIDYDNGNGFGIRLRYNQEECKIVNPQFPYAFGYGNFFNDQMTVSIGKLGGSPWGTGGPELWKELETANGGGMRVEWKPSFIPENFGKLNAGFVLNYYNGVMEDSQGIEQLTLLDILSESVIGISYTHDLFMVRLAYRFDSPVADVRERGVLQSGDIEGDDMVYRVEEHFFKTLLPGFSIWALGYLEGVTANKPDFQQFQNWLFAQYDPDKFTAQLRLGYRTVSTRSEFLVKPSFYWHFFDRLLTVGASFEYCQDFGDGKYYEGSPFAHLELEPKIQLNFTSSYIAFVYNWRREFVPESQAQNRDAGTDPIMQTQRMNLRFCIYY